MDLGTDSINDFNIKYKEGSYFIVTDPKGKKGIFKTGRLHENKVLEGRMCTNPNKGFVSVAFPIEDIEADFSFPKLGAINYDKGVCIVTRNAVRQWRRSLTFRKNVISITLIDANVLGMHSKMLTENAKSVHSMFFPEYYNINEAIELILKKKKVTVALNSRYYIGINLRLPYIYLGYNGYIIGRVRKRDGACLVFPSGTPLIESLSTLVEVI